MKSPISRELRRDGSALWALALLVTAACRSTPAPPPAEPAEPPRLAATRFVAYGDDITEGFQEPCPTTAPGVARRPVAGFVLAQRRGQPSATAYPARLQELLAARYPSQMITVINEGQSGEDIEAGVANLPRVLTVNTPQVLLLQEGVNTINQRRREGIPAVVDGLKTMIQEARSRSITVFAATLLPERPGGCRAYDSSQGFDDIIEANIQIRRMVGMQGAILVDLYEAFNGRTGMLIGEDGLHPSELGYQRIAETFFAAIRKNLEN